MQDKWDNTLAANLRYAGLAILEVRCSFWRAGSRRHRRPSPLPKSEHGSV